MDFTATTTLDSAPIWRSCRVAMRRNPAVCTHAHSKYAGSGSGLF